ncbi:anthranilate synthase component I family protein [Mucilaginibacter auburnensis]|uniref:Para-aminobenzoate synthetase component 1 n=1 Tax=Mucilaginibacter auburnensis TaxID=1457233 RepID=A0A2H9VU76_9SPHI|nr:anthranilate synthase component I family protein [Mucilaginibacter auburnensis]PJJ84377.1 para-aminobenzoate synthetase component 1 [Mucilaginibacter auburnensis]
MVKLLTDTVTFKHKALQWAATFDVACYLDSNNFKDAYSKFDLLIAAGAKDQLTANAGSAFEQLATFREAHPGWITGFFSYDLKNEVEDVFSANPDQIELPDLHFFAPLHLIMVRGNEVEILSDNADHILIAIEQQIEIKPPAGQISLNQRFSKQQYIDTANKIKEHITRGDIYVTNFCQEFYAEEVKIDPAAVFAELNRTSPKPFAAFYKWHNTYALCASPERFLAKRDNKLISQPIKGTAPRGKNAEEDEALKHTLRNHTKEQQENVMIVDLVRNDLTRSAKQGTVKTKELFGIYSFQQVHQMISTVVCELDPAVSAVEAVRNTFPMGSMTGAPKIRAMQLMEQYERTERGLYSGAIGYFSPDNDFDFNVVIRTLLYNADSGYLSFQAGSAITYHADAKQEYQECLLKAKAVLEVLGND